MVIENQTDVILKSINHPQSYGAYTPEKYLIGEISWDKDDE